MKRTLRTGFGWVGVGGIAVAVLQVLGANSANEAAMTQSVAFGVIALACFRASDFFKE